MVRAVHIARRLCALGWLVLCLLCAAGRPLLATEPAGHVVLDASWAEDRPGHGPNQRLLRLTVRPLVPLEEWTLTVTAPEAFDVRAQAPPLPTGFRSMPRGDGRRELRAEMPGLATAELLTLDFEVTYPSQGGGMVSLTVDGIGPAGHRFHEAVGVTARSPTPPPVRRLGAAEYPAKVLTPARQR